jgi:hypothetical protein
MSYVMEIPGIGVIEFAFPSTAAAFAGALGMVARRSLS